MNVLVIGGSRFTGPKLINRLITGGHQVTVFNRGNHNTPAMDGVKSITGDRNDESKIKEVFSSHSFDIVVDTCAYKPNDIDPLLRANCSPEQYVCYSTGGVYSDPGVVPFNETDERGENHFWNSYGVNKARLENRLFQVHNEIGFPTTVLRFPYIYGPNNHLYREASLIDRIRDNRVVPIPSDGQTLLQFIYVDDVARAIESIVEAKAEKTVGEAYNIGEPQFYTYEKVVKMVADVVGTEVQTVAFEPPETAPKVFEVIPFGNSHMSMDVSKWLEFADWECITFREGLTKTLDWYDEEEINYNHKYDI